MSTFVGFFFLALIALWFIIHKTIGWKRALIIGLGLLLIVVAGLIIQWRKRKAEEERQRQNTPID